MVGARPPMGERADPIAAFYDLHPYPPPVPDLDALASRSGTEDVDRVAHHLIWPDRAPGSIGSILVAGCGTSQAARHALRNPAVKVVGIDVSPASIEHTQRLVHRHGITNLSVHRLPIERVAELDQHFDHVVCTGVLHHLAEPEVGLRALREVLAPRGAVTLMVYGRYGRFGIALIQDYCRRLGVTTDPADIADLVATLREIPNGHPISRLLRETRDFLDDDALADALLNPRERSFSVPELLDLVDGAGLRFGRWVLQAPYLPECGSVGETPHAARIGHLSPAEAYSVMELFRGTLDRHSAILYDAGDSSSGRLDFAHADDFVPIVRPGSIAVDDPDRLPPGTAAALIQRAHPASDLVLLVEDAAFATFRAIDGHRSVRDLGADAASIVERLWWHDLVVIDASGARTP